MSRDTVIDTRPIIVGRRVSPAIAEWIADQAVRDMAHALPGLREAIANGVCVEQVPADVADRYRRDA